MTDETNKPRCTATTKSGAQCRTSALPGVDYCALHSPQAAEGRKLGGVNRSDVQRGMRHLPPTVRDIADLLSVSIVAVAGGRMKPAQLSAMAAGGSALVRIIEAALLAQEVEALRRQVDELVTQRAIELRRP